MPSSGLVSGIIEYLENPIVTRELKSEATDSGNGTGFVNGIKGLKMGLTNGHTNGINGKTNGAANAMEAEGSKFDSPILSY